MLQRLDLPFALLFLVGVPGGDVVDKYREEIYEKVNELRSKGRLEALTRNAQLDATAQKHAENMARQERATHELDGKHSKDRVLAEGYEAKVVAENVALVPVGTNKSPAALVDAWRYSAGHYKNIMLEAATETGVGAARGKSGKWYVCQVLATPKKP